ncbi:2,5-didehydrogluconate reductase [Pleurocapsa sp. CCALA 161]|uniref:aldo/keto reductase n=1 Tax=Pleurocapsa sp. CCALA 161 TaxID=2107688 RepID=UPI000D04DDEC|nr:aldo/keto reductase [Pleurocapsa sp. CCALA 161]PSB08735.1 2,5-didehydrogluconate reductase [Pleurocapsa sp. CCALA 161]
MESSKIAIDNVSLPSLGIGTWSWGDRLFWGYGSDYGETEVARAFETAVANGATFFDTAEVYGLGESERLLGRFLKRTSQPVQIATKYFPLPWRFNRQAVADTLTDSLKRLQVEQVALYQVHMPFSFLMSQHTLMAALAQEVKRGRILSVGVSNYSASQMQSAYDLLAQYDVPLAVNQVRYSLLTRTIEQNGILELARKLNIKILAYSPLDQGLLTGKYTPENREKVQGARKIDPKFSTAGLSKIEPVISNLQQLAEKYAKTPAQIALNWLMAQENVIPIPGAKNAQQAQDNAGAMGWKLSAEDAEQLSLISLKQ